MPCVHAISPPAPRLQLGRDGLPDAGAAGEVMHALAAELFPLCRSLTGDPVRETFRILAGHGVPLAVSEVPSGTPVYDWVVPPEWNVREAWIADPSGRRVVDLAASSLHVMSYSVPVSARMPLADLRPHLHTLPETPHLVPYRTSYWDRDWGFCLSAETLAAMPEGEYEVRIDATLEHGSLTYAEAVIPGLGMDEVLISTHACHPSLANDNLSGVVLAAAMARYLAATPGLRHTYRILLSPGTIGPLTWLSRNEARLPRIRHGLVVYCVGDPGQVTYKRSRREDAEVDQAAVNVLRERGAPHAVLPWVPWGGDERQFCSPGFDLPVGALMRTPPGRFPENHTSADDLDFVRPEHLADSLEVALGIVGVLEANRTYVSLNPKGEPQLGRRGLYRAIGGTKGGQDLEGAMLWVLNLADGEHTLLDISDRSGLPFSAVRQAAETLVSHALLGEAPAARN
jgi:aminopeptidase-like protein